MSSSTQSIFIYTVHLHLPSPSLSNQPIFIYAVHLHLPSPSSSTQSIFIYPVHLHLPSPSLSNQPIFIYTVHLHLRSPAVHESGSNNPVRLYCLSMKIEVVRCVETSRTIYQLSQIPSTVWRIPRISRVTYVLCVSLTVCRTAMWHLEL